MDNTLEGRSVGPRFNFLLRLKLWQKFALLGFIAVALIAYPVYRLVQSADSAISWVQTEQSGMTSISAALELIRTLQDHRGSSSYFVLGDEKRGAAQPKNAADVEAALARLDAIVAQINDPQLNERVTEVKQDWAGLKDNVTGRKISQRQVTEVHIEMIADVLHMVEDMMGVYKFENDQDVATHYMAQSTLVQLPRISELLGQLRSPVVSRLQELANVRAGAEANKEAALRDAFRATDRVQIDATVKNLAEALDSYVADQNKAMRALPELEAVTGPQLAEIRKATAQAIGLVQREILAREFPTVDVATYLKEVSAPREVVQKAATQQDLLAKHLERRIAAARTDRLLILAGVLVLFAIGAAIAVLIVRNITTTVAQLQASVESVRAGDATALQSIESRDEVGDLGRTVNSLLQERIAAQQASEEAARKAEAENERLNNSVISILQAVNQLSQRDLTAKAPVTQDIIGTVSDSINALTDETAKVLHSVSRIAGQVAEASGNVRSQAALVSRTAEDERSSVEQMVTSLADATQTMNRVSALAEQSNSSAAQATQATDTALETVNGTVRGMESIRETISETEKRIKRLGERSQEISGIVNLINTISERTHVLALNASMQAAVAGEAGRGFAVVAEEVQRLAESSRNATQQIATLVSNIQLETNETISTVNRTIGQVVDGSEQAQKAGEQMRRTQEITAQLVAQVKHIGDASSEQKTMSANLLAAVQRIGDSTARTGQQIDAQNQETETLLQSAHRLLESVNVFKLPQAA